MPPEHSPTASAPPARALSAPVRWLLLVLALACLALGIMGLFLPVLPTVPFLLLAAWAAGHSSPRLSQWLEQHPRWGAPIRQWRHGGVVSRRAKWSATAVMTASAITTAVLLRAHWAALAAIAVMACVLVWLWLRPEQAAP
ncbi:MAG: YbaN family protein [Pseudomonadota bacterium]|nr:YbaN family protein [Pseudomonadota bacterium]